MRRIMWTNADDEHVGSLDPLNADELLLQVPQWNADQNTSRLAYVLEELCQRSAIESRSYYELLAIVRDLGIVAGSLKRHGVEPSVAAPKIDSTFTHASAMTELVPRDTLMHYTIWNPSGPRLR